MIVKANNIQINYELSAERMDRSSVQPLSWIESRDVASSVGSIGAVTDSCGMIREVMERAIPEGPYTLEMMGEDVIALLDTLGIVRFIHWIVHGGMIGQFLAINHPIDFIARPVRHFFYLPTRGQPAIQERIDTARNKAWRL